MGIPRSERGLAWAPVLSKLSGERSLLSVAGLISPQPLHFVQAGEIG